MKSAVFYGKHDLRVEQSPMPQAGAGEVLIQVKACGVCGTDVHIFEGDKGAADTHPPCILGHEFAGVVAAVGEGVEDVAVGDRVCVDPNDTCGSCYFCKSGINHFCEHMTGIGTTVNGGFAEYVAVRAKQVYRLAEGATFEQGAMTEPVACCLHGIDMCDIQPGDTVLVIGGGMIGLIMLQLAKLAGAARVILSEPAAAKREMALSLGADAVIDPSAEEVATALEKLGAKQVQCVIECAGLPATMEQAISLVGKKGTVMMFGLTKPDDTIALKPFAVFQKEITLRASYINPYTQGRAIELINTGKVDVSSMVLSPIGLEELAGVLSDPAKRALGKYIVRP